MEKQSNTEGGKASKEESYKNYIDELNVVPSILQNKNLDSLASNSTIDENKLMNVNDMCNLYLDRNLDKGSSKRVVDTHMEEGTGQPKDLSFPGMMRNNPVMDFLSTPIVNDNGGGVSTNHCLSEGRNETLPSEPSPSDQIDMEEHHAHVKEANKTNGVISLHTETEDLPPSHSKTGISGTDLTEERMEKCSPFFYKDSPNYSQLNYAPQNYAQQNGEEEDHLCGAANCSCKNEKNCFYPNGVFPHCSEQNEMVAHSEVHNGYNYRFIKLYLEQMLNKPRSIKEEGHTLDDEAFDVNSYFKKGYLPKDAALQVGFYGEPFFGHQEKDTQGGTHENEHKDALSSAHKDALTSAHKDALTSALINALTNAITNAHTTTLTHVQAYLQGGVEDPETLPNGGDTHMKSSIPCDELKNYANSGNEESPNEGFNKGVEDCMDNCNYDLASHSEGRNIAPNGFTNHLSLQMQSQSKGEDQNPDHVFKNIAMKIHHYLKNYSTKMIFEEGKQLNAGPTHGIAQRGTNHPAAMATAMPTAIPTAMPTAIPTNAGTSIANSRSHMHHVYPVHINYPFASCSAKDKAVLQESIKITVPLFLLYITNAYATRDPSGRISNSVHAMRRKRLKKKIINEIIFGFTCADADKYVEQLLCNIKKCFIQVLDYLKEYNPEWVCSSDGDSYFYHFRKIMAINSSYVDVSSIVHHARVLTNMKKKKWAAGPVRGAVVRGGLVGGGQERGGLVRGDLQRSSLDLGLNESEYGVHQNQYDLNVMASKEGDGMLCREDLIDVEDKLYYAPSDMRTSIETVTNENGKPDKDKYGRNFGLKVYSEEGEEGEGHEKGEEGEVHQEGEGAQPLEGVETYGGFSVQGDTNTLLGDYIPQEGAPADGTHPGDPLHISRSHHTEKKNEQDPKKEKEKALCHLQESTKKEEEASTGKETSNGEGENASVQGGEDANGEAQQGKQQGKQWTQQQKGTQQLATPIVGSQEVDSKETEDAGHTSDAGESPKNEQNGIITCGDGFGLQSSIIPGVEGGGPPPTEETSNPPNVHPTLYDESAMFKEQCLSVSASDKLKSNERKTSASDKIDSEEYDSVYPASHFSNRLPLPLGKANDPVGAVGQVGAVGEVEAIGQVEADATHEANPGTSQMKQNPKGNRKLKNRLVL
ncbi:hypothetical protein PCYB_002470 [Plasmodium cynomolgi strain B]|uniref:RdRp catalytic domain-containing protein n=1 Tax=Plasmodium cynomolgi (strain B) TaxID=1120755 RepID=K6UNH6_PLACD|nr:hypothetical protein PCYB_002470 [Plasmodium cynomolgi strain B]GAB69498.1 hypothetical protein PCYB_002470 [Plasmodium cynomolgi strain B]